MQETDQIAKDIEIFLTKNQDDYETFTCLKDNLIELNKDNFPDTIKFIQDHKKQFLTNHKTAVLFFFIIILNSEYNFKKFDLYLDILIYFQTDIKSILTEAEMLTISGRYEIAPYYLFSKHFFSIESIVAISYIDSFIFIFIFCLPEIREYDPEYAQKREQQILKRAKDKEVQFYNFVINNIQKHIEYRDTFYNPSLLHKAIREDDTEAFLSLLSKNNYSINEIIEFSFYERSRTIEDDLNLIQIAAVYGSTNIFKFLWIQDEIVYDDDLILYATFGQNFDIIHMCERNCKHAEICVQPILIHRQNILEYIIDNYGDQFEESVPEIKEGLKNFSDDENNYYSKLTFNDLCSALDVCHYEIIKSCLPKIIFIIRNIKMNTSSNEMRLLSYSNYNYNLCEFLFEKRIPNPILGYEIDNLYYFLKACLYDATYDSFKFVFNKLIADEFREIFIECYLENLLYEAFSHNHYLANYILELEISGKLNFIKEDNLYDYLLEAIKYYNEDVVVNLIKLIKIETIQNFEEAQFAAVALFMDEYLSTKTICSLFSRLSFLPKEILNSMSATFLNIKNKTVHDHIQKIALKD